MPLSLGGALLVLILINTPISLPVMIGVLMLMGIVAKNSILLVDIAIEEMRAGKTRLQAIVEAGHKRARPIVMTTVAMVAACSGRLGLGRSKRVGAHGDCRHRRADHLDFVDAGHRAGGFLVV